MHEVDLGRMLTDYITGEEILETTYEDLRQACARMLIEEKKYPRTSLFPKYVVPYSIDGHEEQAVIDIAVFSAKKKPLLALFFCPGDVGTFLRQYVATARIHFPEPFPLTAVTDSKTLLVAATFSGEEFGRGFYALPLWANLKEMLAQQPVFELCSQQRSKESRIVYAYSGLSGPCCGDACAP